ncbi:hypothetical protein E2542_SST07462 [Spatholobus suberectus]|nr:hypothetical protein E2542_SST07462 [Spatholobus suberectus]
MARKRNISIQYERNPLSEAQALLGLATKKLRRLPHVFSRVLELPFRADADVSVQEAPHCFRFVAETDAVGHVEAHTVEIHPGVTKVVVRESGSLHFALNDLDLQLDVWRIRLPESTRPDLATAVLVGGELVVTVPKSEADDNRGTGAAATLVLGLTRDGGQVQWEHVCREKNMVADDLAKHGLNLDVGVVYFDIPPALIA